MTESVDPHHRRLAEFTLFSVIDRLNRATEAVGAPRFDFDERHEIILSHDEIDIAMS